LYGDQRRAEQAERVIILDAERRPFAGGTATLGCSVKPDSVTATVWSAVSAVMSNAWTTVSETVSGLKSDPDRKPIRIL
jgi:hypothetical protein